jgi:hypothetical protein
MTVEAIIEEIGHLSEAERKTLFDRINPLKDPSRHSDSPGVTGEALIAAMQASPHKDVSLEPSRYRLPVREITC